MDAKTIAEVMERVCNDVGRMGLGNVKDGNMADAAVGKLSGKDIGSFFRMTVNRSVGDRYRFLFRRIGAPFEGYLSMSHGDLLSRSRCGAGRSSGSRARQPSLKTLYGHAEFSNDICIITSRLREPGNLIVDLVSKDISVDSARKEPKASAENRIFSVFHR